MTLFLDNTLLSNFALIGQTDLLRVAVGELAAVPAQVMAEYVEGVKRRRVPSVNWKWLPQITLLPNEQHLYQQLLENVNAGEAACLAMAYHQNGRVLTDDRDARKLAARMRVPVSGTLGMLVRLVQLNHISLNEANDLLRQMITQGYRSPLNKLDTLLV